MPGKVSLPNLEMQGDVGVITTNMLGQTLGLVYGTFSFALMFFAVVFVAAALLSNVRAFKAVYLSSVPRRYRHDGGCVVEGGGLRRWLVGRRRFRAEGVD